MGTICTRCSVRCGPPDMAVALAVMRQACDALRKAAEQGIVHRDIKPENIMISQAGEVKVADFGLARLRDDLGATNLTQAGFTMGTPLYMSPEQIEGKPLDPRSDIYSLGVTSYQMLSGRTPFVGETAISVAVQHMQNEPEPLEKVCPHLPPALCRVIHKMLAKNPAQRYESARLLLKDLRGLSTPLAGEEELSLIEQWADEGGPGVPTREASTAQLSTVMLAARQGPVSRRGVALFAVGLVATFMLGLGIARATRPKPTLRAADAPWKRVERKSSAEAQYLYALMVDNEDGWRSVVEYFPQASYFDRRAEQQLARLYMQQDDYPRALALFEKFADMDDTEVDFRAFGLAGAAAVLSYQNQPQASAQRLAELWPLRQHLDPQMKSWIVRLISKSGREHHDTALQQWDEWLNPKAKQPATSSDHPTAGDSSVRSTGTKSASPAPPSTENPRRQPGNK